MRLTVVGARGEKRRPAGPATGTAGRKPGTMPRIAGTSMSQRGGSATSDEPPVAPLTTGKTGGCIIQGAYRLLYSRKHSPALYTVYLIPEDARNRRPCMDGWMRTSGIGRLHGCHCPPPETVGRLQAPPRVTRAASRERDGAGD